MLDKTIILNYLQIHKLEFEREFGITKLGLFGSFARNEASEASDIDIMVEFEANTSDLYDKKESLRTILQNEFNRNVDLCREKYIKPYFRAQILNSTVYV